MATAQATEQRRGELRRLIQTQGFAALSDLVDELAVSESTVRRDLDHLVELGEVQRTHGGVFWTGPSTNMRLFENRRDSRWDEKRQIAVAAAQLICDHDTILLDGGSTTYEVARQLIHRPLQVVTNSLPVANLLSSIETIDLILLGGYVHSRTGVSLGPFADAVLQKINVRRTVLSVAGADSRGYYNSNLLLVETEQAMVRAADEVIVVADSSKFGHASLARMGSLDSIHTLVTDDGLSDKWAKRLEGAGVRLIVAPREPVDAPQ